MPVRRWLSGIFLNFSIEDTTTLKQSTFSREIDDRDVALAIVFGLQMWTDKRYAPFLQANPTRASMGPDWFKAFLGDWSVARTISAKRREQVRDYLNRALASGQAAGSAKVAVDLVASEIRSKKWTHQVGDGKWRTPLSLVSKVAFFLQPDTFVPMDRFSKRGINWLRGTKIEGGEGHHQFPTYEAYLAEFERWFEVHEARLDSELGKSWVGELSGSIGCSIDELARPAFRRKVFDTLLMRLGDRWADS